MKLNRITVLVISTLILLLIVSIINLVSTERVISKVRKLTRNITASEEQIDSRNISIESPVNCNIDPKVNTWLISYASNGATYFANQNFSTQSAINKCIDFVKPYNNKHIDKDFLLKNIDIMQLKRGAGYWLWKPYIILKTLNEVPDGDIVLYLDSGAYVIEQLDKLFNSFNNKDIIVFENFHPNRKYVKRYLLQKMNMDNEQVRNTTHLQAGFIAIKNSKVARDIIAEWLEVAQDKDALTDSQSDNEYPQFIEHRHDQAILSLISIKYSENFEILSETLFEQCKKYFCLHRRSNKDLSSLPIQYIAK